MSLREAGWFVGVCGCGVRVLTDTLTPPSAGQPVRLPSRGAEGPGDVGQQGAL